MPIEKPTTNDQDLKQGINSTKSVFSNTKAAVNGAKNTAKKVFGSSAKKAAGSAAKGSAAAAGSSSSLGTIIAVVAVVAILLGNLNMPSIDVNGSLGMTNTVETNRAQKEEKLVPVYKQTKWKQRKTLVKAADERFDCGASAFDESSLLNSIRSIFDGGKGSEEEPDKLEFVTDEEQSDGSHKGCEITFDFYPGVEEMTNNVTAYAAAVDGTIAYFDDTGLDEDGNVSQEFIDQSVELLEELEKEPMFVETDENELGFQLSDHAKEVYKKAKGADTDAGGIEAITYIGNHAKDYFVCDTEPSRWTIDVEEVEETRVKEEKVPGRTIYRDANGNIVEPGSPSAVSSFTEMETKEIEYTWKGHVGTITVPMYYGLQKYRMDDLEKTVQKNVGKNYCSDPDNPDSDDLVACTYDTSKALVQSVMDDYYKTYQQVFNEVNLVQDERIIEGPDDTDGFEHIEAADNRDKIFEPFFGPVESWNIPIYGLNEYQRLYLLGELSDDEMKNIEDMLKYIADIDDESIRKMLEFAMNYMGTPYVLGTQGPGTFDCSGFVYYVINNCGNGWHVPRLSTYGMADSQYYAEIPRSELQAGDIILIDWNNSGKRDWGHVGIYMGNGRIIHTGGSPGVEFQYLDNPAYTHWYNNPKKYLRLTDAALGG